MEQLELSLMKYSSMYSGGVSPPCSSPATTPVKDEVNVELDNAGRVKSGKVPFILELFLSYKTERHRLNLVKQEF